MVGAIADLLAQREAAIRLMVFRRCRDIVDDLEHPHQDDTEGFRLALLRAIEAAFEIDPTTLVAQ
jgi:hypothetical protein